MFLTEPEFVRKSFRKARTFQGARRSAGLHILNKAVASVKKERYASHRRPAQSEFEWAAAASDVAARCKHIGVRVCSSVMVDGAFSCLFIRSDSLRAVEGSHKRHGQEACVKTRSFSKPYLPRKAVTRNQDPRLVHAGPWSKNGTYTRQSRNAKKNRSVPLPCWLSVALTGRRE